MPVPAMPPRRSTDPKPRLYDPAGAAPPPRPVVVPIMVGTWPGRLVSWTADQWAGLPDPPAGSFLLAGGVRVVLVID